MKTKTKIVLGVAGLMALGLIGKIGDGCYPCMPPLHPDGHWGVGVLQEPGRWRSAKIR